MKRKLHNKKTDTEKKNVQVIGSGCMTQLESLKTRFVSSHDLKVHIDAGIPVYTGFTQDINIRFATFFNTRYSMPQHAMQSFLKTILMEFPPNRLIALAVRVKSTASRYSLVRQFVDSR